MESTTKHGIVLLQHPGKLSGGDIDVMLSAVPRLAAVSKPFATWLLKLATTELQRRAQDGDAEPTEPQLPRLDCAAWSTPDLCDATLAAFVACRAHPAGERFAGGRELLEKTTLTLLSWQQARASRAAKSQGNKR